MERSCFSNIFLRVKLCLVVFDFIFFCGGEALDFKFG